MRLLVRFGRDSVLFVLDRHADVDHRQQQNTTAWTTQTSTPSSRNGSGTRSGTSAKNAITTLWSAMMLPMRRIDSETGRAMWLISSIGSISGISQADGPRKCLKY